MPSQTASDKDLRSFCWIWALIFFLLGCFPLSFAFEFRIGSLIFSFVFVIISMVNPLVIRPFYNIWIKFGDITGNIVAKIILVILYFSLFAPISLLLKLIGKDLLNRKIERNSSSYWINREEQPGSMKNQF